MIYLKSMNKVKNAIGKRKTLVFFDLEGTQSTHEMIAIGAIKVSINSKGRIKKYHKPFLRYVKCKSKVGTIVKKLTLISDEKLKKDGIEFFDAMEAFKKYVGVSWKNALFLSFGTFDIKILEASMTYTFHCPTEICNHIRHNYYDYQDYITSYIKDDKNNSYSLINYCKLFDLELAEPAHSPENDAINLARLYDAFIENKHIVREEFKKTLAHLPHVPKAVLDIMTLLKDGETIDQNKYEEILNSQLDD